ncbi:uncharacterized protein LOC134219232 isoform X2 [Armigeres subalbatus]
MSQAKVYLEINPAVAVTVLSELLANCGFPVDEPDPLKIAKVLGPVKTPSPLVMVSIPLDDSVEENNREITPIVSSTIDSTVIEVSHEQVPKSLQFVNHNAAYLATSTPVSNIPEILDNSIAHVTFNEIELALLNQCSVIDEENMELAYLRQTLSLSMMEAEFLRMQLRLFNLKARSILELFQYCDGSNIGFCRCPEIRKRIFEMGILVQRQ